MRTIILFFFVFLVSGLKSQKLDWAYTIGGTSNDQGNAISVDDSGYLYVTGNFMNTVDFDPGSGTVNLTSLGSFDVFVAKYTASGALVWAKGFGSPGSISNDFGKSIAVDKNGNVNVTGTYSGTIDLDPGSGTKSYTSAGSSDIFIIQLDKNGVFKWGGSIGGSSQETGKAVTTDPWNNVIVSGNFTGTADLDPGPGTENRICNGDDNFFILKLNPSGNMIWVQSYGAGGKEDGNGLVTDNEGNIYLAGGFAYTVNFNPTGTPVNLTGNGNSWDILILKLDSNGGYVNVRNYGGAMNEVATALDRDASGNIYIGGYFRDTATDIDPGSGVYKMTSVGGADVFVAKLNSNFDLQWARGFGDSAEDWAQAIKVDAQGKIYICGFTLGNPDFYPGEPRTLRLPTSTGQEIFLQSFDNNGNFLWAKVMGSTSNDFGNAIALDKYSNVYATGYYRPTSIDADPHPSNTYTLTTKGNIDMFLLKWNPCDASFKDVNVTACKSYNSPSGKFLWTKAGNYGDVLVNSKGCDSVVFINLSFSQLNKNVTANGAALSADATGVSYQWVNCSNMAPISGATSKNYTATVNGNYAVILTSGNCKDTSACVAVTGLSVKSAQGNVLFGLYPNPGTGIFSLQLPANATIIITDVRGTEVYRNVHTSGTGTLMLDHLADGYYHVSVLTEQGFGRMPLVLLRR